MPSIPKREGEGERENRLSWACGAHFLMHSYGSVSRALKSLYRNQHVLNRAERQPGGAPSIHVHVRRYSAADALVTPNRPELLKTGLTADGGLVNALADVYVVDGTVGRNLAKILTLFRWVMRAEVLEDVELCEGMIEPAVHGEIAVSVA